jgi:hypothetical protein
MHWEPSRTTFVGFSAIIMIFRQTVGGSLSPLDSWITLVFVQLGFLVTAGSLSAPLLALCDATPTMVWRVCNAGVGLLVATFAASYPLRRRAVSGMPTPVFVWIDLLLLAICTIVLLGNAVGRPRAPNPASFSVGLTGMLFTAGLGYLHALSSLHKETKRAARDAETSAGRTMKSRRWHFRMPTGARLTTARTLRRTGGRRRRRGLRQSYRVGRPSIHKQSLCRPRRSS